jgi:hypothetical protein
MKTRLILLAALALLFVPAATKAQTVKSLGVNTTSGIVQTGLPATNDLTFTNGVSVKGALKVQSTLDLKTSLGLAGNADSIVVQSGFYSGPLVELDSINGAKSYSSPLSSNSPYRFVFSKQATNEGWAAYLLENNSLKDTLFQSSSTNTNILTATNWTSSSADSVGIEAPSFSKSLRESLLSSLLGFTTNGQVVANTGTNVLTFTNSVTLAYSQGAMQFRITPTGVAIFSGAADADILTIPFDDTPIFSPDYYWSEPSIRQSFGFSTNLNTFWTATNSSNARSAIGLGATNSVIFQVIEAPSGLVSGDISVNSSGMFGFGASVNLEEGFLYLNNGAADWNFEGSGISQSGIISFKNSTNSSTTRTNLGLPLDLLTNVSITNFQKNLFSTNTAPTNTTAVSAWATLQIGTNSYRFPLYK